MSNPDTSSNAAFFLTYQKNQNIMLPFTVIKSARLKELRASQQKVKHLLAEAASASAFIQKIGQGSLDTLEAGPASDVQEHQSELISSLLGMREQMKLIATKEKERSWATEGLARFVEILRSSYDTTEHLYNNILSNLITYVSANQGGLFVVQEESGAQGEETFIDLVACYAYDRKKYLEKRIHAGEGLVGQCYLEAQTVYMTAVPEKYVHITSGLGEAAPRSLLIVPLKIDEKVYGILELASFNQMERYQIEFIEKLGESIASAIASAQISRRTRELLEVSQVQTEQLRASEEEIRQNMEELETTQEEMRRKETEMAGLFTAINTTLATVEMSMDGNILTANDSFLQLMGYTRDELRGKHHSLLVDSAYAKLEPYKCFWQDLRNGIAQVSDFMQVTKNGAQVWMQASYTPVLDGSGKPYKVIKMAQDITDKKKAEIEAHKLSLVADNTDNSVVITDKEGCIEYVNKGFERLSGYTFEEVKGRKPGSFLQGPDTDKATIARIRQHLAEQKPFYEEIINYTKTGCLYWISLSINPVFGADGQLEKFVAVQTDITPTKLQAVELSGKLQAINKSNGTIEFDLKGNILMVNDSFLQLMGYTLDEVQGKHHSIFINADERNSAAYQQFWHQFETLGISVGGEYNRVTKSGNQIWVRATYNTVLDTTGRPFKVFKVAQDITEQKAVAFELQSQTQELRAREEEMRRNMDETLTLRAELAARMQVLDESAMLTESDLYGTITYVNDKFCEVSKWTREEVMGKPHSIVRHPDNPASLYKGMWATLKSGGIFKGQFKNRAKDGTDYWVDSTIAPVLNAEGETVKYIGIRYDITHQMTQYAKVNELLAGADNFAQELRAQEEELRQSMEEMHTIQEETERKSIELAGLVAAVNSTLATIEFDMDGIILKANDNFLKIMDYTLNEIQGKHHSLFVDKKYADSKEYRRFWEKLNRGQPQISEVDRLTRNGDVVRLSASYTPALDANGTPIKVIKFAQVITVSSVQQHPVVA